MHLAGDSKSDNSLLGDMGLLHEYRRQWLLSMVVVRSSHSTDEEMCDKMTNIKRTEDTVETGAF
jgi:hypothetical protein